MYSQANIKDVIEDVSSTPDLVKAQKMALEALSKIAFNMMVELGAIKKLLEEQNEGNDS